MQRLSIPRRDNELLGWALRFSQIISTSYEQYGLTQQQSDDLAAATQGYRLALNIAQAPSTRTVPAVTDKNDARTVLRTFASSLGKIVQANLNVSDGDKIYLGLIVPAGRTSTPTPPSAPSLYVLSVSNQTIEARIAQSADDTGLHGRPSHSSGAVLFSYLGEQAPTSARQWTFEKLIAKTRFTLTFTDTLPPGTKVWLSAAWFNHRKEIGPPCAPVGTNLQGGGVQMTGSIRMAA